jgi:hypothetical protein
MPGSKPPSFPTLAQYSRLHRRESCCGAVFVRCHVQISTMLISLTECFRNFPQYFQEELTTVIFFQTPTTYVISLDAIFVSRYPACAALLHQK